MDLVLVAGGFAFASVPYLLGEAIRGPFSRWWGRAIGVTVGGVVLVALAAVAVYLLWVNDLWHDQNRGGAALAGCFIGTLVFGPLRARRSRRGNGGSVEAR